MLIMIKNVRKEAKKIVGLILKWGVQETTYVAKKIHLVFQALFSFLWKESDGSIHTLED